MDDYFEEEKLENVNGQVVKRERTRLVWQERDDHGRHGGESADVWPLEDQLKRLSP